MASPHMMKRGFEGMDVMIDDPGTGKALPNDQSGIIAITIAAGVAETNTLADPDHAGLELTLVAKTVGAAGSRTVTTASQYTQAGDTKIYLDEAQDAITLVAVPIGSSYRWVSMRTAT